jgi:hypothetical protein
VQLPIPGISAFFLGQRISPCSDESSHLLRERNKYIHHYILLYISQILGSLHDTPFYFLILAHIWFRQAQLCAERTFGKKNLCAAVQHDGSRVMVWGCISSGISSFHQRQHKQTYFVNVQQEHLKANAEKHGILP